MKLAVLRERDPGEPRVAATPETVKKIHALGPDVTIEAGAGMRSGIPDDEYAAAGATDLLVSIAGDAPDRARTLALLAALRSA